MKRPSARSIALVAVVLSAIAGTTLFLLRRRAEQDMANLEACLLGEPLAQDELASARYRAIELARPREKMTTKLVGFRSELVPEKPIPWNERWPSRCSILAGAATKQSWTLALGLKKDVLELTEALAAQKEPANLDTIFKAGRFPRRPVVSEIPRPWAPVVFIGPLPPKGDLESACPAHTMLATLDYWDDDLVLLGKKPGCAVTAANGRRLAGLRPQTPNDRMVNDDRLLHGRAAIVAGKELFIGPDGAFWDDHAFGNATEFRTCTSEGVRAVLLEGKHGAQVHFVDAHGVSDGGSFVFTEPDFSDRGKFSVQLGSRTMSCRGKEARVAWAWSTAIDQRPTQKIVIATCTPGRCSTNTARVHIETPHWQNCGYCDPDPNEGTIEAPTVLDLFDSVAVLWSAHRTVRARIAPLDKLEEARELVLWEFHPGGWFEPPRIIARGSIALVGIRLTVEKGPSESRLFRLEASGSVTSLGL